MANPVAPKNRPDNVKFEKIWNRAKDCDVASVVLHSNKNTLCMDDRHALTADEVVDCCKHGCIIESNGMYYRPVSWMLKDDAVAGVIAGVVCIDVDMVERKLSYEIFSSYGNRSPK